MNLAGFVHTKENTKRKADLRAGKIGPDGGSNMDMVSRSQRSKSSRRKSSNRGGYSGSPSKRSMGSKSGGNVANDDLEDDLDEEHSQATDYRDIEQPPMNEEIEPSDHGVDYSN